MKMVLFFLLGSCSLYSYLSVWPQPSYNDKYSNPEMVRVMNELAKARKQLKGTEKSFGSITKIVRCFK